MSDSAVPRATSARWWLYTALTVIFVFAMRVHWIDMNVSRLAYWDEISAELVA